MFSIYKVSSLAVVAAISASFLMSASSMAGTLSGAEARELVREQLKAENIEGLRPLKTIEHDDSWVVTVITLQGDDVYKVRVDAVSGELSTS